MHRLTFFSYSVFEFSDCDFFSISVRSTHTRYIQGAWKANQFQVTVSFLYPLKRSKNRRFFDIFRGCRRRTLAWNWIWMNDRANKRSIRSQMFFKIGILKNFTIFTGKHLCWSVSLIKLQTFRLQHKCFPVKFVTFLKTPYFTEHLWWLLL